MMSAAYIALAYLLGTRKYFQILYLFHINKKTTTFVVDIMSLDINVYLKKFLNIFRKNYSNIYPIIIRIIIRFFFSNI